MNSSQSDDTVLLDGMEPFWTYDYDAFRSWLRRQPIPFQQRQEVAALDNARRQAGLRRFVRHGGATSQFGVVRLVRRNMVELALAVGKDVPSHIRMEVGLD